MVCTKAQFISFNTFYKNAFGMSNDVADFYDKLTAVFGTKDLEIIPQAEVSINIKTVSIDGINVAVDLNKYPVGTYFPELLKIAKQQGAKKVCIPELAKAYRTLWRTFLPSTAYVHMEANHKVVGYVAKRKYYVL